MSDSLMSTYARLPVSFERGEGASDAVVKGWLAQALSAPRGPQWVCDNCHAVHAQWMPVCGTCQSFDTLSWATPPTGDVVTPTGTEMFPLIVGALENDHDEAADDIAEVVEAEVVDIETSKDTR